MVRVRARARVRARGRVRGRVRARGRIRGRVRVRVFELGLFLVALARAGGRELEPIVIG